MATPQPVRAEHIATDRRENVAQHDGADLGEKVANAQTALENDYGGEGEVYVPPKSGTGVWQWDTDQTFNFVGDDYGLILRFAGDTRWEYTDTGTALTINSSDDTGINTAAKSAILGGKGSASGSGAVMVRLEDSFKTYFNNVELNVPNGRCVQHANVNRWTEQTTHINGEYRGDIPVEFIPNTAPSSSHQTGGTGGSNSFHDTYFYGTQITGATYCIWLAGVFQYCTMDVTLQTADSGASLLYCDSERTEATQFDATKFESPANPGDVAMIEYGPNFDSFYGPKFDNGRNGFGITDEVRGGTSNPLPNHRHNRRGHEWEFIGGDARLTFDKNGVLTIDDGTNTASLQLDGGGTLQVTDDRGTQDT